MSTRGSPGYGEQIRPGEAKTALSAPQLLGEPFARLEVIAGGFRLRVAVILGCRIRPPPFFDLLLGIAPRRGEGAIRVMGCPIVGLSRDPRFILDLFFRNSGMFNPLRRRPLRARRGDRDLRLALFFVDSGDHPDPMSVRLAQAYETHVAISLGCGQGLWGLGVLVCQASTMSSSPINGECIAEQPLSVCT